MPFSLQYIKRPLLNIHVSKSSVNSLKSVCCKYYSVVILSQFDKGKKKQLNTCPVRCSCQKQFSLLLKCRGA